MACVVAVSAGPPEWPSCTITRTTKTKTTTERMANHGLVMTRLTFEAANATRSLPPVAQPNNGACSQGPGSSLTRRKKPAVERHEVDAIAKTERVCEHTKSRTACMGSDFFVAAQLVSFLSKPDPQASCLVPAPAPLVAVSVTAVSGPDHPGAPGGVRGLHDRHRQGVRVRERVQRPAGPADLSCRVVQRQ